LATQSQTNARAPTVVCGGMAFSLDDGKTNSLTLGRKSLRRRHLPYILPMDLCEVRARCEKGWRGEIRDQDLLC